MHETAKQVLSIMFRSGETICVSPNKFGYHSIPLENAMNGPVILVPTADSCAKRNIANIEDAIERIDPEEITLCALNPIKGYREDLNCTAFRNFLVEMDYGPLADQLAYIKTVGLPYSAAIFSGNKSIHFLVSLDTDLPSESVYRTMSEWILNVLTLADPMTKNPSRSIRIPGAIREPGKKQLLIECKGPVKLEDLVAWLKKYPDSKPQEQEPIKISGTPDFARVRPWVCQKLVNGVYPPNRNRQWFSIAVEFALAGYSEDDTIDLLKSYFSPDRTFRKREWITTIKSAFKWAYSRSQG